MFALTGICDPLLALASMLLGGAAAYVILSIAERMRATDQGHVKMRWLSIGAVAAGLEIWAIHYIGNLAFCPPAPTPEDFVPTILSIIFAGWAGAVAVYLIGSHSESQIQLVFGGLLMGVCICLTHFASATSIHQLVDLHTGVLPLVLSISVIMGLGVVVVLLGAWNITYGNWRVTEKASAMGLALSGSHFAGMIPAYGYLGTATNAPPPGMEGDLLAIVAVSLDPVGHHRPARDDGIKPGPRYP